MKQSKRPETEIFNDLSQLCSSIGYAHVIAYYCLKDTIVRYDDTVKPEHFSNLHSKDRLVRTEISTLIGLMLKSKIDLTLPKPDTMQYLINQTESLLSEIHYSMMNPMFAGIDASKTSDKDDNPFAKGSALRESIFYSGESAYSFQYRDLAPMKYNNDNQWLIENRGFSVEDVGKVISSIFKIQNQKFTKIVKELEVQTPDNWTILPGFMFSGNEIASDINLDKSVIDKVLLAFTPQVGQYNQDFNTLSDFNISNACPLVSLGNDQYLLFQYYSLVEAFYESPYYWMVTDKTYRNQAMKNRGAFTERFCKDRLEIVFGKDRVFSNIQIVNSKKNIIGEIDVLVVFANRAIILQAKSKRLTIEARKGNDKLLKDDFKKSIQDSYNQGLSCSQLISNENFKLINGDSKEICITRKFKEIYIFCIVSDQYPALSFQTRQFLKYTSSDLIMPPLVTDIFTLDVISEMLNSPLQFLSYINRRVQYLENVMASHELTILSYHLQQNLWVENKHNMLYLDDDISVDLDVAMMVRRESLPGKDTPEGILTRFNATAIGNIIQSIEGLEQPGTIDLGLMLLQLSEDTVYKIIKGIENLANLARKDGNHHDFTVFFEGNSTGLTVHCNYESLKVAGPSLQRHCEIRKYLQRADNWFGISLDPNTLAPKYGLVLNFQWEWSKDMEGIGKSFSKVGQHIKLNTKGMFKSKIDRNDPCHCGSGVKYKKCCMKTQNLKNQ